MWTGAVKQMGDGDGQSAPGSSARPPSLRRPMVLHVRVVTGAGGGPEKTILRSAKYTRRAGLDCAAAYIHPTGDAGIETLRKSAAKHGCPFFTIAESAAIDPRTVLALRQLCRQLGVTVWHGHDYKSNVLGLMLRRCWPMRLVTTLHGWTWDTQRTRFYYHLDNWCLRHYEEVLAVSPQLIEHCRTLGISESRLTHVPNGVDTREFAPRNLGEAIRRKLKVDANALVIGVVARLSPEKGVERAIKALAQLRQRYPHAELHLVGDGPLRDTLKQLAHSLGVRPHVKFWGWQKDARPFYEMMDLLLLPSRTEGSPNAVLEAMAMNVPVAAAAVGSVRDLLENGRCGVVLDPRDRSAWLKQLAPLMVNDAWRAQLARQAQHRVAQHYSFAARMEREIEIYRRLLGLKSNQQARRRAA